MPAIENTGELQYRISKQSDRVAIIQLWQQVFGDEPAFIEASLDVFVGKNNLYVAETRDGQLQAILSAVPCRAAGEAGVYLYALATRPTARGAGVMTHLMTYAEGIAADRGAAFAILIPAGEALFDYYRHRGYDVDVPLRRYSFFLGDASSPMLHPVKRFVEHRRVDTQQWLTLRRHFTEGTRVDFAPRRTEMLLRDLYADGMRMATIRGGSYALWWPRKDDVLVAELAARGDFERDLLLASIAETAGSPRMVVTLPQGSTLLKTSGQTVPHALAKPLRPGWRGKGLYLRFGFNELDT